MTCTNPIELDGQLDFPCGKCMACRIQRTQEWAMRMVHEQHYHESCLFITLTYDDENLPPGKTLVKNHLIGWLKRFRRSLEPRKIKYYANGEYGEKEDRPHYHAILYGVNTKDFEEHPYLVGKYKHETWKYGFIDVEILNYYTARYVAGYIRKKLNGKEAIKKYKERVHPFKSCSQGLGKLWAIDHEATIKSNGYIIFMGKKLSIPRYYIKVLGIECQYINSEREEQQEKDFQSRYKKQKIKNDDEWSYNLRSKAQKDRNIQAQIKN